MNQSDLRPFTYDPPLDPYLTVIHADDHVLILDKPEGILTVPGKRPGLEDCLLRRAQRDYPRASLVHRLDKDTSGVMVFALHHKAQRNLGRQFEKRRTRKTYEALVWGTFDADSGTIDAPIATDWPNRPMQRVDHEEGRPAITHWEVVAHEGETTRLRLTPETGRSHQLRVHMLHLGHPVLGDNLYAPPEALAATPRLMLHASALTFRHPDGGAEVSFSSPCPF